MINPDLNEKERPGKRSLTKTHIILRCKSLTAIYLMYVLSVCESLNQNLYFAE